MEIEDFQGKLTRALEAAIAPAEEARRVEIEKQASERVRTLVRAVAETKRAEAQAQFGWFCLVTSVFVIGVAVYMRFDGKPLDSLVVLMLALIPLLGGGWHLHMSFRARRQSAAALEQLGSAGPL